MIEGEELKYINIDETIKYLGAPNGAKRNAKSNFPKCKIEKFRKHLER
jgi:hypothetical protein